MRSSGMVSFLLALGGPLMIGGCTMEQGAHSASAASAGRQCFRAADVNGFSPIDRDTVDVTVGAGRTYRLELFAPCQDVNWSQRIAIRSRGSSWICTGNSLQAELIVPDAIGPDRCMVNSIRRLSEEERDAARRRR
jgi:hypothetical protein